MKIFVPIGIKKELGVHCLVFRLHIDFRNRYFLGNFGNGFRSEVVDLTYDLDELGQILSVQLLIAEIDARRKKERKKAEKLT